MEMWGGKGNAGALSSSSRHINSTQETVLMGGSIDIRVMVLYIPLSPWAHHPFPGIQVHSGLCSHELGSKGAGSGGGTTHLVVVPR